MNKIQNLQSNHMFVCEWEPLVPKVLEVENQGGAYWIFADQSGRCDDLANQLRSRGINCIRLGRLPQNTAEPVVEVYSEKRTLNTDDLTQLETTLRELAIDRPPSAIIFGWGMDSVTSEKSADPNALLETTSALLTLIQSVIRHVSGRLPTINVITLDAESVGENAKRCFPCWQSALPGIGGTAALEHPDIVCRFLDIENTEDKHDRSQNAQLVTDLLLQSETEERIAVRNGLAFGLRMQEIGSGKTPALSFSNTMKLKPGANYILSGGYGEIGIRLVADMVERGARHLTLIGRTPPDKDTMSGSAVKPCFFRCDPTGCDYLYGRNEYNVIYKSYESWNILFVVRQ